MNLLTSRRFCYFKIRYHQIKIVAIVLLNHVKRATQISIYFSKLFSNLNYEFYHIIKFSLKFVNAVHYKLSGNLRKLNCKPPRSTKKVHSLKYSIFSRRNLVAKLKAPPPKKKVETNRIPICLSGPAFIDPRVDQLWWQERMQQMIRTKIEPMKWKNIFLKTFRVGEATKKKETKHTKKK